MGTHYEEQQRKLRERRREQRAAERRRRARARNFVHYCPGDAVGSPAGMRREDAERYLEQDQQFVAAAQEAGVPSPRGEGSGGWQLPHIGGTCRACRKGE